MPLGAEERCGKVEGFTVTCETRARVKVRLLDCRAAGMHTARSVCCNFLSAGASGLRWSSNKHANVYPMCFDSSPWL